MAKCSRFLLFLTTFVFVLSFATKTSADTFNPTSVNQGQTADITLSGSFSTYGWDVRCSDTGYQTYPRDISGVSVGVYDNSGNWLFGYSMTASVNYDLVGPGAASGCGTGSDYFATNYKWNPGTKITIPGNLTAGTYHIKVNGWQKAVPDSEIGYCDPGNQTCDNSGGPFTTTYTDSGTGYLEDLGPLIVNGPTIGCTNSSALNYNSSATQDDGSCVLGSITVASNIATSWNITGPANYPGSGTGATYTPVPAGTYSISVADLSCYSKSILQSASQTVSTGNPSIRWDITYTDNGSCGPPPTTTYTLTISKNGTGSGTVTGAGTYNSGTIVDINATANPDSSFAGWSGDSGCAGNASHSITMDANKACVATFDLKPPVDSACTISITADSTSLTAGGSTTLRWYPSSNTTSVTASGANPNGNWTGSKSTAPNSWESTGALNPGSYTFNISCNSPGGSNSDSVTVNVGTPPPDQPATGWLDGADCSTFGGWAYDPDSSGTSIYVNIYRDGIYDGQVYAGDPRSDVDSILGISGNHGYNGFTPNDFKDGYSHSLYAKAVDWETGVVYNLNGSPKTITCAAPPAIVDGVCSNPATHYICSAGNLGAQQEYSDRYEWWCNGTNGGSNQLCVESKPPPGQATVNVTSNINTTTWTIAGPDRQGGTYSGTYSSTYTGDPGSYTITPAIPSSYTLSMSPSTNPQTVAGGGTITWNLTYTLIPTTCQDTTASNYGGALPCTWPPQNCLDTTATNYGQPLPCTYKYSCNSNNQCVTDPNGKYNDLGCNNKCAPTAPTAWIKINGYEGIAPSVAAGSNIEVTWGSVYANFCQVHRGDALTTGPIAWEGISGDVITQVNSDTRFRINCQGDASPAAFAQVSIDVTVQIVLGCTNPAASNYNPSATTDNGSCTFTCSGSSTDTQSCTSGANVCSQTANGTQTRSRTCNSGTGQWNGWGAWGACSASTPPNSSCPAPTCSVSVDNSSMNWNNSGTTIRWSSNGQPLTTSLNASGNWSGGKTVPSGSQGTGHLEPGSYSYSLSASGPGGNTSCGPATVSVSPPVPTASNINVAQPNYCVSGPDATISWSYSDPSGSPQTAYQVQVSNTGNFNSPFYDSGQVSSGSTSRALGAGALTWNVTYRARVRVWNSYNSPSDWLVSNSWKTPIYAYPQVGMSWTPKKPAKGQSVPFTDRTIFGGGNSNNRSWAWTFGDGGTSSAQNPTHTYANTGAYPLTLTVTDAAGQTCGTTGYGTIQGLDPTICNANCGIDIQKPIPRIKEVAPR